MKRLLGVVGLLIVVSGCASTAKLGQALRSYAEISERRQETERQERYLRAIEESASRGSFSNPVHVRIDPY